VTIVPKSSNTSRRRKATTLNNGKAPKPYQDFPLTPHKNGQWCKRIKGTLHYFGPWGKRVNGKPERLPDDGWKAALDEYERIREDLYAGRTPRAVGNDEPTVQYLCNHFLTFKQDRVDSGELASGTFRRYHATCGFLISELGKKRRVTDLRPEDFQSLRRRMAKRWGAIALGNEIQIVRCVFLYAYEAELIDKPIRFGPAFDKPSAKTIRTTRAAKGPRMFAPKQINDAVDKATVNMRAMIYLGINAALGNTELGLLPIEAVDLESGWLEYARSKTGMPRRVPLWPETVDAIRDALANRSEPLNPDDASLLFIGPRGQNYVGNHKGYRVTQEFTRIAKAADIEGRTFYDLRRTFETIAGDSRDQVAVDFLMGHSPNSSDMASIYRQKIEDERLRAVVDHVRSWLFSGSDSEIEGKSEPRRLRVVG
jgi:integrase